MKTTIQKKLEGVTLNQIEKEILELIDTSLEVMVFTFVDFFCNECFGNWNKEMQGLEEAELSDVVCPNCNSGNVSYHSQTFTR